LIEIGQDPGKLFSLLTDFGFLGFSSSLTFAFYLLKGARVNPGRASSLKSREILGVVLIEQVSDYVLGFGVDFRGRGIHRGYRGGPLKGILGRGCSSLDFYNVINF
jgi:hypothetical protein